MGTTPSCTFDRASIEQNELAKQLYYILFNETKVSCKDMDIGYPVLVQDVTGDGPSPDDKAEMRGIGDGVIQSGDVVEYALTHYRELKNVISGGINQDLLEQAFVLRGIFSVAMNKNDEAIKYYDTAIAIKSNDPLAHNLRGTWLKHRGLDTQAVNEYLKAIEIKPDYAEAYFNLGIIRGTQNNWNEAIINFSKAVEINPSYAKAYYNLGIAFSKKLEWDKAFDSFSRAIEINPKYFEVYSARGGARAHKNELDEGITDCLKAVEINPQYAEGYFNLGLLQFTKNDWDQATTSFLKTIQIEPEYAEAYFNLGLTYVKKGQLSEAIKSFGDFFKLSPTDNVKAGELSSLLKMEWENQTSFQASAKTFETETGSSLSEIKTFFICSYSFWEGNLHESSRGILANINSTIQFKTPPSSSTKQFFNEMFALMPEDMAQDEEVKKVLGSLKGKLK